jgi:glutathione reductase (NADPH)
MHKDQFDLVVIGAGTGGVGVARPCAQAGWKVAIIDSLPYGGTCMLRGCDPKKMLIAVTEGVDWANRMTGNGLESKNIVVNWPEMMAFKRTFTDVMPDKLEQGLSRIGIETVHGDAQFTGEDTLQIGERKLQSKYFHIATGARPGTLGIPGEEHLITSTDFLDMESTPQRIVFVGGGFIAFEFAHISKRAGASEVTILQRGKHALVNFDPDLTDMQIDRTKELGVEVHCEAVVEGVVKDGSEYTVEYSTSQGKQTVNCDHVVHAAGRVPNIDTLNLEVIGVETGRRGIKVNEYMRSLSNSKVFSVGDCADTGAPNLTPVSANEARIAAKNLLAGKDSRAIKYPPIPSVAFTLPPVARVGLLESEAKAAGLEYDVNFGKTDQWYSSMRVGEKFSAYKVLVEKRSGIILGAHIMGPGAEEQINIMAMAMGVGMTANQLKGVIFAYPSYASDLGYLV